MNKIQYTDSQQAVINLPFESSVFLSGPFGVGKTTTALGKIELLIKNGLPGNQILVITPQHALASSYHHYLKSSLFPVGYFPTITSLGGLARRIIKLFWPYISVEYNFDQKDKPPIFLNIETAQFHFADVAAPYLDRGYLINLSIQPNRIYSQILDTMNKAATMGFPLSEIPLRLQSAWVGDASYRNIFDQAYEMAGAFRMYCYQHNLLDFSLQVELLMKILNDKNIVWDFLSSSYKFVIADNIEEDTPATHDFLKSFLEKNVSTLLIYDERGGYRTFLGANPTSAQALQKYCDVIFPMDKNFSNQHPLRLFAMNLYNCLFRNDDQTLSQDIQQYFSLIDCRFYPEMISNISEKINTLIQENLSIPDIAVLSPYLPDSLRFSIFQQLSQHGIPYKSNRPSRPLCQEPAVIAILTFAKIANPNLKMPIKHESLRLMLMVFIPELDIVRAHLMTNTLLQNPIKWNSFDGLIAEMQSRITFSIGEKYQAIYLWLQKYQSADSLPLDIFISKVFGEILSQPGFGMHDSPDMAAQIAHLIASIKEFREMHFLQTSQLNANEIARKYIQSLESGLISAQYESNTKDQENAVLVAPALTFLTQNTIVDYQFWLDIGNLGWWERLNQPLTHPYVLSREWKLGDLWSDAHEYKQNQENLARMVNGLAERCRKHIFLYSVEINESGTQSKGPLLQALQILYKRLYKISTNSDV